MATVNFNQGENVKLMLQVKDNGANVDVSSAPKIKCVLKTNDGTIVKKYSNTAETDYGVLMVDSVNNYQINVFVEREESLLFPVGLLRATLIIAFIDVSFPNGERVKEYPFTIGWVYLGQAKDENMSIP